ncbi:plastocyanin/azurin family copper-binding protein [Haloplanus litoreus]|uniref:Plastocyanin/azurin family copper-binding protein n=1 Tax=Haloplanus litoreus TaxID=767515 RepID=A0ABD6A0G1_9EURY
MNRRRLLRLGGAALFGGLTGCSAGGRDGRRVAMTDDFDYEPARLTVATGTTVRWENAGAIAHTVTADGDGIPADADYFASGGFGSERAARADLRGGLIGGGEGYEHAFGTPGTYDYVCLPHEGSGMTGTVVVQP